MPDADWELLLDVKRLVSRAHLRVPRGIDRVELEYVQRALCRAAPFDRFRRVRFVANVRGQWREVPRWLVLGLAGALRARWERGVLGTEGVARALRFAFGEVVGLLRPPLSLDKVVYFDVGHHGSEGVEVLAKHAREWRSIALVHDVMPWSHPEFFRDDARAAFATWLEAASAADVLLVTSDAARLDVERACAAFGRTPHVVRAPLGVVARRGLSRPEAPYFVMLGRIERRKNVQLLLQVWRGLEPGRARLYLVGSVGDGLGEGPLPEGVTVRSDVSDAELADLLAGARALLFPSRTEGYGLPLLEALSVGVPVIASRLAAFQELGGGVPELLDPDDPAAWRTMVLRYLEDGGPRAQQLRRLAGWRAPTWDDHFVAVEAAIVSGVATTTSSKHTDV